MPDRILPSLLLATLLGGCAVGPDYRTPASAAPAAFHQAGSLPVTPGTPEAGWWRHFRDPVLDDLVARALDRNHDLRLARARLDEARALRRGSLWALAPGGGAGAALARGQAAAIHGGEAAAPVTEVWSAGLDASWEIDLFGRNRRQAEAAAARTGIAEAELRATQVALLAELAASYFSRRHAEASLTLLDRQIASVQHSLDLTRRRVAAGRGTPLDTARLESLWHETRALRPDLERELAGQNHRLAVLLGLPPGDLALPPASPASGHATVLTLDAPADLLRRRPDVQRAERVLAAATAGVGVETAAFFPTVNVAGVLQFAGLTAGSLGDADTRGWSAGPALRWDLLDYGRLHSRLQGSRARAAAALADYEKTVLLALEDAENRLAAYRAAVERRDALEARRRADEAGLGLAGKQLEAGGIDPLAHLDVERASLASSRDALAARRDQQLALVAVYKAFAGGWGEDQSGQPAAVR